MLPSKEAAHCVAKLHEHEHSLLSVPFVSVQEYLHLLRALSLLLDSPSAMIYACAAVSDFFIPHNKMTEHKIQVEKKKEGGASLMFFLVSLGRGPG